MATYQTTYGTAPAIGLPGQISSEEQANKISRTVESAAGIGFGQPAFRGAGDHGVIVYEASAVFVGLAVLDPTVAPNSTTPDAYPQYETASIMTSGPMFVTAGESVTPGDTVYWNTSTKRFTKTNTDVAIPDAKFEGTAADGEIVEITIKLR